jgi:hypothetical protein
MRWDIRRRTPELPRALMQMFNVVSGVCDAQRPPDVRQISGQIGDDDVTVFETEGRGNGTRAVCSSSASRHIWQSRVCTALLLHRTNQHQPVRLTAEFTVALLM